MRLLLVLTVTLLVVTLQVNAKSFSNRRLKALLAALEKHGGGHPPHHGGEGHPPHPEGEGHTHPEGEGHTHPEGEGHTHPEGHGPPPPTTAAPVAKSLEALVKALLKHAQGQGPPPKGEGHPPPPEGEGHTHPEGQGPPPPTTPDPLVKQGGGQPLPPPGGNGGGFKALVALVKALLNDGGENPPPPPPPGGNGGGSKALAALVKALLNGGAGLPPPPPTPGGNGGSGAKVLASLVKALLKHGHGPPHGGPPHGGPPHGGPPHGGPPHHDDGPFPGGNGPPPPGVGPNEEEVEEMMPGPMRELMYHAHMLNETCNIDVSKEFEAGTSVTSGELKAALDGINTHTQGLLTSLQGHETKLAEVGTLLEFATSTVADLVQAHGELLGQFNSTLRSTETGAMCTFGRLISYRIRMAIFGSSGFVDTGTCHQTANKLFTFMKENNFDMVAAQSKIDLAFVKEVGKNIVSDVKCIVADLKYFTDTVAKADRITAGMKGREVATLLDGVVSYAMQLGQETMILIHVVEGSHVIPQTPAKEAPATKALIDQLLKALTNTQTANLAMALTR